MLRYDSAITSVHICRNGVSQAVPTVIFNVCRRNMRTRLNRSENNRKVIILSLITGYLIGVGVFL